MRFYSFVSHVVVLIFTSNVFFIPMVEAKNNLKNDEFILPVISEKDAIKNEEKFKDFHSRKCGEFIIVEEPIKDVLKTDDQDPQPQLTHCSVEQI